MFPEIRSGWRLQMLAGGALAGLLSACVSRSDAAGERANQAARTPVVSVMRASRKALHRTLTVSSELVPFEQIDVYAKESGFVRKLDVDFGSHVTEGQVMAVLEIPELQMQLEEDQADIKDATSQVDRTREELNRAEALQKVTHLEFTRLDQVARSRTGLVAQQEVDNRQGKDLAAQAQAAAANSVLSSTQSQLVRAQAKFRHDQVLFDYSKITAPFTGVVTKRYANLGTLMQSGMNSNTQALPLVQLSQNDLFRLVIPVPESYVRYIRIGDPVDVRVPSLDRSFPGRVARFSVDVEVNTRTMHTEVNVPNPTGVLVPGLYAEAALTLDEKKQAIAIPPEAINIQGDGRSVWVVDPSGQVQARPVTLGVETPAEVEVVSGLKEGEMVAVGDRSALRAGETVAPKEVKLLQYQTDSQNRTDN